MNAHHALVRDLASWAVEFPRHEPWGTFLGGLGAVLGTLGLTVVLRLERSNGCRGEHFDLCVYLVVESIYLLVSFNYFNLLSN